MRKQLATTFSESYSDFDTWKTHFNPEANMPPRYEKTMHFRAPKQSLANLSKEEVVANANTQNFWSYFAIHLALNTLDDHKRSNKGKLTLSGDSSDNHPLREVVEEILGQFKNLSAKDIIKKYDGPPLRYEGAMSRVTADNLIDFKENGNLSLKKTPDRMLDWMFIKELETLLEVRLLPQEHQILTHAVQKLPSDSELEQTLRSELEVFKGQLSRMDPRYTGKLVLGLARQIKFDDFLEVSQGRVTLKKQPDRAVQHAFLSKINLKYNLNLDLELKL